MPVKKSTAKKPEAERFEPAWLDPPETSWRFDFGKFAFGLFLIIIGLLYLAKNTGWLPIQLQFDFWQLWPMILIFFGLSFISGKGWSGIIAGSILTMTVLALALVFISDKTTLKLEPELTNLPILTGHLPSVALTRSWPISIDQLTTSQSAKIAVKHSLGIVNIAGGSDKLITGALTTNYARLLTNSHDDDNSQNVSLESTAQDSRGAQSYNQLNLQLSDTLPLNLTLDTGSSDTDLNLTDLTVKNLTLDTQGSTINLSLANQKINQNLTLNGQISTLTVNLPIDTAIKITSPDIKNFKLTDLKAIDQSTVISKNYRPAGSTIKLSLPTPPDKLIINWQ